MPFSASANGFKLKQLPNELHNLINDLHKPVFTVANTFAVSFFNIYMAIVANSVVVLVAVRKLCKLFILLTAAT